MLVEPPRGMNMITVGGVTYVADQFGVMDVPDAIGLGLLESGAFKEVTERSPPER